MDRLEQLSYGLGTGLGNQAQGMIGLAQDPIGSAKATAQALAAIARDPRLAANAMYGMWNKARSGPEGFGQVVGENINPRSLTMNLARQPMMAADVIDFGQKRFEKQLPTMNTSNARQQIEAATGAMPLARNLPDIPGENVLRNLSRDQLMSWMQKIDREIMDPPPIPGYKLMQDPKNNRYYILDPDGEMVDDRTFYSLDDANAMFDQVAYMDPLPSRERVLDQALRLREETLREWMGR
jgi:hypothetical protein